MNRPLIAFDTETATVRGAPHLVEVGAVRVVDGEVVDHFQRLVRPLVPIEPEAAETHGLADEDVSGADDAPAVLAEFFAWIGADWIAAHNARADAHVVAFECARHGLTPPSSTLLDSLALARRALPEAEDHRLSTLVEHLDLECERLHRALPDAVACWKIIEACVERMGGWDGVSDARLFEAAGVSASFLEAAPRRPRRRPALVRTLEQARNEEDPIWLLYGEGDEPAARLEVRPRMLYQRKERAYLEAECVRSGLLKTYRLDRVRKVEARR